MRAKYKKAFANFLKHCEDNGIPMELVNEINICPAVMDQDDPYSAIIVTVIYQWEWDSLGKMEARYVYKF